MSVTIREQAISQMPQEDGGASELNHPEVILRTVFPANDHAAKIMKPCEQALDFPTAEVSAQHAAVLRCFSAPRGVVRSNQVHTEALSNLHVQRVTVVSAIADRAPASLGEATLLDRWSD